MNQVERYIHEWLARAGLKEGEDIVFKDPRLFGRIMTEGSVGAGEAFMDGWWDSPHVDHVAARLLRTDVQEGLFRNPEMLIPAFVSFVSAYFFNHQSRARAEEVAHAHYNLDNNLFERMLGKRMLYSCAYYERGATNLDQAQEDKMTLIAEKMKLEPGMRILSIGCGWGELEHFLAERYGVSVLGVSIATEQVAYAQKRFVHPGVEFRFQDYREIPETDHFDRVMSIAMFEAVGHKNFRSFFKKVHRLLVDEGIFLLHTIGSHRTVYNTDPWINKYIFPNGMLPSVKQIAASSERLFVIEDWHNFGPNYDTTLLAWFSNFEKAWPTLSERYDERFYRMWKYYLLTCAGSFRARRNQLWQIVFSKRGLPGGYAPVR